MPVLCCALGNNAGAQTAQCPCTYTLTQEQRQLLQSMHGAAATWAAVRSATTRGTLDADAYEALSADYDAVMAEIIKQDQVAAKKADTNQAAPPIGGP